MLFLESHYELYYMIYKFSSKNSKKDILAMVLELCVT